MKFKFKNRLPFEFRFGYWVVVKFYYHKMKYDFLFVILSIELQVDALCPKFKQTKYFPWL